MRHFSSILVVGVMMAGSACWSAGGDWPQWRGTNRNNIWPDAKPPEPFPETGLSTLWRVEIGWGYSSPIVSGDRVFVTDSVLSQPVSQERVLCFDRLTGRLLWSHVDQVKYPDWVYEKSGHRGGTPTPLVHEGKLYVLSAMGIFYCFNHENGQILWQRNVAREFEMQVPEFGTDSSPLIEGNLIILLMGGKPGASLVALDKQTGQNVWTALDERRPYSSPIVAVTGHHRQLIVWTQKEVNSLDPATGQIYWTLPNPIRDYSVATPVYSDGLLLVSGMMLRLHDAPPAAELLWPQSVSKRVLSNTSTPYFHAGHIYSARSHGQLVCLDAGTGQTLWETDRVTEIRSGASIHITPAGDRALLYNDQGQLILARLSPAGYEELSRAAIIEPTYPYGSYKVNWSPPAYAFGCVFVRSDQELVCVRVAPEPEAKPVR